MLLKRLAERVVVRQEDGPSEATFSCKPHSGPQSLPFRAPTVTDTSCVLPFTRQVHGEKHPTIKCYRPTVIPHHKLQSSYCDTSHKELWYYSDTSHKDMWSYSDTSHKVQSSYSDTSHKELWYYCDTSHKELWSYCDTSTQSAVVRL